MLHSNQTESSHDAIVRIESRCMIKQNMSWYSLIRWILYGKNAPQVQFFQFQIERINTATYHVALANQRAW